jgi:hypothetical protein
LDCCWQPLQVLQQQQQPQGWGYLRQLVLLLLLVLLRAVHLQRQAALLRQLARQLLLQLVLRPDCCAALLPLLLAF